LLLLIIVSFARSSLSPISEPSFFTLRHVSSSLLVRFNVVCSVFVSLTLRLSSSSDSVTVHISLFLRSLVFVMKSQSSAYMTSSGRVFSGLAAYECSSVMLLLSSFDLSFLSDISKYTVKRHPLKLSP
jgi:hypothetical protein